jgi:hypothetical protein
MSSVVVQHRNTGRANSKEIDSGQSGRQEMLREPAAHANLSNFVAYQNISRFVDQFQIAHDPDTRKRLQTLLLEELNRFGFNAEQLQRVQQRIRECKVRIDQHERLINKARINGHNVAAAERVLKNLMELQEVFWSYHQVVLEALNRSKL